MAKVPWATVAAGALVVLVSQSPGAQSPTSAQSQPFATGTTAITVDIVVRDAHGRPVTDLTRGDFALLEDGVRQDVADVQLVAPPDAAPGATASDIGRPGAPGPEARPAPKTITAPMFVALVFDRLSPEARYLAYKGSQAYLATQHENDFAGVFLSDLSLVTVQPYTNDKARVAKALKDVASRATSTFDRSATRAVPLCPDCGDRHPSVPFVASADSAGRSISTPSDRVSASVLSVLGRSDILWERLSRNEQGFATTNALIALVSALGSLPGRKTVVFFAEGLALPDAVMPHFRSVVAAANRASVSIYTVDAAGLRVQSQ